jgi:fructose-bisphosphate aldolase class II
LRAAVFFVFHGGSGSSRAEIREAISYGVVKMVRAGL